MKKEKLILLFIILLAAILRLWNFGAVPPSPDWDEASLGYNAYSILHTGKDEYGATLPFILRSFDDYKPGLYVYLIIPFIKLFGLTITSVRLPSALFGIITVLATYYLVRELIDQDSKWRNKLSLLSAFLLAISPWHIQFSRIAFESNVGDSFTVLTLLFFLKGLKKPVFLIPSVVFASFNLYMYQSEKVFIPLIFLGLILLYGKKLLSFSKKSLVVPFCVGVILVIPLVFYTATNSSIFARAKGVSVFSDITPFLKENVQDVAWDHSHHDILGLIVDNRRFVFAKSIFSGYISHFDLNWLFVGGDLARHHAPDMGILYLWELPFLFIGFYIFTFSKDFGKKSKQFIFLWFFLVSIPASITSGVPHAVRTLNFLPLFQLFTACGLLYSLEWFNNKKYPNLFKKGVKIVCVLIVLVNVVYYLDQYFVQQNYYNSQEWQYGYKDAVGEVRNVENQYKKIIVSNVPYLDQSYIFFLFYLQYPPEKYQLESANASGGFKENHSFGKFEFRPISWNTEAKKPDTLYVGKSSDFPSNAQIIKTINFLDGSPAITLVRG